MADDDKLRKITQRALKPPEKKTLDLKEFKKYENAASTNLINEFEKICKDRKEVKNFTKLLEKCHSTIECIPSYLAESQINQLKACTKNIGKIPVHFGTCKSLGALGTITVRKRSIETIKSRLSNLLKNDASAKNALDSIEAFFGHYYLISQLKTISDGEYELKANGTVQLANKLFKKTLGRIFEDVESFEKYLSKLGTNIINMEAVKSKAERTVDKVADRIRTLLDDLKKLDYYMCYYYYTRKFIEQKFKSSQNIVKNPGGAGQLQDGIELTDEILEALSFSYPIISKYYTGKPSGPRQLLSQIKYRKRFSNLKKDYPRFIQGLAKARTYLQSIYIFEVSGPYGKNIANSFSRLQKNFGNITENLLFLNSIPSAGITIDQLVKKTKYISNNIPSIESLLERLSKLAKDLSDNKLNQGRASFNIYTEFEHYQKVEKLVSSLTARKKEITSQIKKLRHPKLPIGKYIATALRFLLLIGSIYTGYSMVFALADNATAVPQPDNDDTED